MLKFPTRRLVSQDDAAITERPDVPRSRFTGSWTRKTAFNAGELIPFMVEEVLPGDHLKYNVTAYIRMATPLFPLFDNQRIDTFFFFVPNRLVWANWQKFMGEQNDPTSSISYTVPTCTCSLGGEGVASLFDHMGLPVIGQVEPGEAYAFNVLPFRAYNLIYNQWFRDQNLINSVTVETDDGPDTPGLYELRRRAKSHDYFTSALPWPQKFTAPTVPLGGLAPVLGIGFTNQLVGSAVNAYETDQNTTTAYAAAKRGWIDPAVEGDNGGVVFKQSTSGDISPQIYADLSQATGVAINTLRQAWMVQSLLERDARGGTRYVELLRAHFGVVNPDFRLQRPEYIGGGQTPLQLTPIAQTAPTSGVPLGALGAAGTAVGQHRASYAATEHGYIIGIINVRTELSYQQGLHRMWSRSTRYDFYWPSLAGLGEQAILRKEIYTTGHPTNDDAVFGYQERWHEYRTRYSEVTGLMRSTSGASTLDAWHLAQEFETAPTLNSTFIGDSPPMDRVLAAAELADNQQYLADILIQREAVRPLPMFGTPTTLGRF